MEEKIVKTKQDGKSYSVNIIVFFCILFLLLLIYISGDASPNVLKKVTGTIQMKEKKVARKEVPLYFQWDKQWQNKKYANGNMKDSGCGPTCLSMVTVYLKQDEKKTPDWMADFSTKHHYVMGGKTAWLLMSEGAEKLGLKVKQIPKDEKQMKQELQQGKVMICSMGPGHFTKTGHFIVLSGYKENGFKVRDPNSKKNSKRIWKFSEIQSQIKNIWVYWV